MRVLFVLAILLAFFCPSIFKWAMKAFGIMGFFIIATCVDISITLALIGYHLTTLRPWMVGDDIAEFFNRANDRFFRYLAQVF